MTWLGNVFARHQSALPLVASAVVCACLPLFHMSGRNFEYEYSLIVAISSSLLIPYIGVGFIRVQPEWISLLAALVSATLVAMGLMWASECPCSVRGFQWWWWLNAVPAIACGVLGYYLASIAAKRWGRLRAVWWLVCGQVALILVTVWLFWFLPQKRLTHPIIGFLHGPIYDRWIPVDSGVVWMRLGHVLVVLSIFVFVRARCVSKSALALLCAGMVAVVIGGQYPSQSYGKGALDQFLNQEIRGNGFVLRFHEADTEDPFIQDISRAVQFHLDDLSRSLGLGITESVWVYVWPSREEKKLHFGGNRTDIADVRTPAVHITKATIPHPTLRHELVHAFLSPYGPWSLGFHPNMVLTEGIAEVLAPRGSDLSLSERAGFLIAEGYVPPLETIFGPLFWTVSGDRAYTVAKSFLAYLLGQSDPQTLLAVYGGSSFEGAYGRPMSVLVAGWRQSVLSAYDGERTRMIGKRLYRSRGVLSSRCPHSKQDLHPRRDRAPWIAWRRPFGWMSEQDYKPWLRTLHLQSGDQSDSYRFEHPNFPIWAKDPNGYASDIAATFDQRFSEVSQLEDLWFLIKLSDLLSASDNVVGHLSTVEKLYAYSKEHSLGESLSRQLHARYLLRGLPDSDRRDWYAYLSGAGTLPQHDHLGGKYPIVDYLAHRWHLLKDKSDAIEPWLAMYPSTKLPENFQREWYRLTAEVYLQKRRYREASDTTARHAGLVRGERALRMEQDAALFAYIGNS